MVSETFCPRHREMGLEKLRNAEEEIFEDMEKRAKKDTPEGKEPKEPIRPDLLQELLELRAKMLPAFEGLFSKGKQQLRGKGRRKSTAGSEAASRRPSTSPNRSQALEVYEALASKLLLHARKT